MPEIPLVRLLRFSLFQGYDGRSLVLLIGKDVHRTMETALLHDQVPTVLWATSRQPRKQSCPTLLSRPTQASFLISPGKLA